MKIPFNMTVNTLRLNDGEEVVGTAQALHKKGIFGDRHGELYVTNQRIAFVKATTKQYFWVGWSMGAVLWEPGLPFKRGDQVVEPSCTVERRGATATKAARRRKTLLTFINGKASERFMVSPESLAALEAAMPIAAAS